MRFKDRHKPLQSKQVHVWCLSFREHTEHVPNYYALLSDDEKIKASKFHFEKDKNQSIISRGALRQLSALYLDRPIDDIAFTYGEYGKPEYSFKSYLKFNVSHSGDMAIIGFVKDHDIGVDIEHIKTDFDVMDIAVNYFSELEIKTLKAFPKKKHIEGFYRCWTRKEAFIKAKSQGLSFPLNAFSVSIDSNNHANLLETKWDKREAKDWKLFSFTPNKDYIGAVSIKGAVNDLIIL